MERPRGWGLPASWNLNQVTFAVLCVLFFILPLNQLAAAGAEIDFVDILASHADLKQYLALRDSDPLYAEIRGTERLGIPCFVKEDGSKTLDLKEVLK